MATDFKIDMVWMKEPIKDTSFWPLYLCCMCLFASGPQNNQYLENFSHTEVILSKGNVDHTKSLEINLECITL